MARAIVPGRMLSLSLLAIGLWTLLDLTGPAQQPAPPQPQPPASPPGAQANPLDEPIGHLMEARRNFTQVRNYTCTLIKRERVHGVLQDQNIILFSSRVQPLSFYMKWISPHKLAGQEVAWVEGRNRNMMRVKAKGVVPGALGFINIAPDDPRVMQHSRHKITEAGLGHMIEENLINLQKARGINKTAVRTDPYIFDKRPCLRIETVNQERDPSFYCYRSVLFLEKTSKLPMRQENYDWPAVVGGPGDLLEEFSYADLKFNTDMREDLFNK